MESGLAFELYLSFTDELRNNATFAAEQQAL